ncbi:hypothetical protein CF326_g8958 [Tilletia indica]|nr:hypothetical protein CF326_g8958 [Tilletia indica]
MASSSEDRMDAAPGANDRANDSAQFIALTKGQFNDLLASVGVAPRAADTDSSPSFPSFRVDPSSRVGAYKLWDGCPLNVPDDLVQLFLAGWNIPLSLLTVAAVRDQSINLRRSAFNAGMSGRLLEEFNSWHLRDQHLPFPEWCQASLTLIFLFRSLRGVPEGESIEDDPIHQLTEHVLNIATRVNASNWPIFRDYDKRIRLLVWQKRPKGEGMPFSISSIHAPTLDDAENLIGGKSGSASDYAAALSSGWAALVTAPASEIPQLGKRLSDFAAASSAKVTAKDEPPRSAQSSPGKRKAEDDGRPSSPTSAFRPAGSSPFTLRQPVFCVVCRSHTDKHIWHSCPGPYPPDLFPNPPGQSRGWTRKGQSKDICAKYNSGIEEPGSFCVHGHYCSQCGSASCRAIEHGVRQSADASGSGSGPVPLASSSSAPVGFSGLASSSSAKLN